MNHVSAIVAKVGEKEISVSIEIVIAAITEIIDNHSLRTIHH